MTNDSENHSAFLLRVHTADRDNFAWNSWPWRLRHWARRSLTLVKGNSPEDTRAKNAELLRDTLRPIICDPTCFLCVRVCVILLRTRNTTEEEKLVQDVYITENRVLLHRERWSGNMLVYMRWRLLLYLLKTKRNPLYIRTQSVPRNEIVPPWL